MVLPEIAANITVYAIRVSSASVLLSYTKLFASIAELSSCASFQSFLGQSCGNVCGKCHQFARFCNKKYAQQAFYHVASKFSIPAIYGYPKTIFNHTPILSRAPLCGST